MTTLTIGRAGRDVGTIHVDPSGRSLSGNTLQLSGVLLCDTQEEALALSRQITGLTDSPDEPVVPITFADDHTLDGFYRPVSTSVEHQGHWVAAGAVPWSGTFEKIGGYAYPLVESILTVFMRTNSHAVAGATSCWWGVPGSAIAPELGLAGASSFSNTRLSAEGSVRYVSSFLSETTYVAQWGVTPAQYYVGAARIEVGALNRVVVGRQVDAENATVRQWRLNNAMVRVTPNLSTGQIDVSHYDGSTWDTAKTYGIYSRTNGTAVTSFNSFRVLYNGPERVSIRLTGPMPVVTDGQYATYDLTLRRGARHVDLFCAGNNAAATTTWQVRRMTTEAATASGMTGGIRALNNDADGNRYTIVSPATQTVDTTNGRVGLTSAARTASFGIGSSVGGSAATGSDVATIVGLDHFAVTAERQIVVGR